ncbi:MAG: 3-dehydroquinate synthase [Anaerolineae bacterium]
MMHYRLEACRSERCDVIVERGVLKHVGTRLRDSYPESKRAVIVTDRHVRALYADQLAKSITSSGFLCDILDVPAGELSKSLKSAVSLWEQLTDLNFRRRDLIVALGGGVITDLAGFVAATYMRSVPYTNVPTTLLAQLDAAIGGKVAVNHERAKNLIGFFNHPLLVCIDPDVLRTLPVKEIRQGLAEAIKVAVVASPQLFEFIEQQAQALLAGDLDTLTEVVVMAVVAKIRLVSQDPYEKQLQRVLNFGHAIGHAIESLLAYRGIMHGDAIAIGMSIATRIACTRGVCDRRTADRILGLMNRVGLPVCAPDLSPSQVCEALSVVRAIRNGRIHLVMPSGIGNCAFTDDLSRADLEHYLVGEA